MKVIDMHCDTIGEIRQKRKKGPVFLRENDLSIDLEKMRQSGYMMQTFAIYINSEKEPDAFAAAKETLKVFKEEMQRNADIISQITSFRELEENNRAGKMSALLSLEEGAIFQDSPDNLQWFYDQGVRMATLTWNYENELAYPNISGDPMTQEIWSTGDDRGLKEKGLEFLREMERLHMIADVSHLSDGGFWDIARYAERPFIASHSNARGYVKAAARNLTDDMIRTLAQKGGVMGLNFCVAFTRPDWRPGQLGASADELAEMAKYIIRVGGEDCLGLGTDFDGISELPQITDAGKMEMLEDAMRKKGLSTSQIEKIFWKNVYGFLKENL